MSGSKAVVLSGVARSLVASVVPLAIRGGQLLGAGCWIRNLAAQAGGFVILETCNLCLSKGGAACCDDGEKASQGRADTDTGHAARERHTA